MRVLDLGSGRSGTAEVLWPEAEVVRVDADRGVEPDVVADVRALPEEIGRFDVILASHVLEHLARDEVAGTLAHWAEFLEPGGTLHVLVPDLVWAAEQIVRTGRVSSAVMAHIYGSQAGEWQVHQVGFTVGLLRAAMRVVGLQVQVARTGPYEIVQTRMDGEERRVVARQVYVAGVSTDGATDERMKGE